MRFQLRRIAPPLTPLLITCSLALIASCAPDTPPSTDLNLDQQASEARDSVGSTAAAILGTQDGNWQAYGGDIGNTKYSPLADIDASNVADLEIAWRRPALDPYYASLNPNQRFSSNYVAAPVVIDGIAFIPNAVGLVEAFDAATGATVWVQDPVGGAEGLPGAPTRGISYWQDPEGIVAPRVIVQRGSYLYALDAETGGAIDSFGNQGRVDLQLMPAEFERFRWGGVPMVVRDVIVVGQAMSDSFSNKEAYRGDVRAFDIRTGELRWSYHTIRKRGSLAQEPGRTGLGRIPGTRQCGHSLAPTTRLAWSICLSARRPTICMGAIGSATISLARAWSRSMPKPASGFGITRLFTTDFGTTTRPQHRF